MRINKSWMEQFGEANPGSKFPRARVQLFEHDKTLSTKKLYSISLFLEKWLRFFQIRKVKSNPEYNIPNAKIVLEDTELRFHPHPKNKQVKKFKR